MSDAKQDTSWLHAPIGLCLSGGGYRAAGFHLGMLAYLERVNLLKNTKLLSTVSGGTFVGAKYTLSLIEKQSFEHFFHDFYLFLEKNDLVKLGLINLSNDAKRPPFLILAMAQVYAETFLKKATGECYYFEDVLNADIQLKEIIFNATEFYSGADFRFQASQNPHVATGNRHFKIKNTSAGKIRMADIVASSSCFPAGFEPMSFPLSYKWKGETIPEDVQKKMKQPLAIMDGGIYDNQGMESLLNASKRSKDPLGLFIISDVDQANNDLYSFPHLSEYTGTLTLKRLQWLFYFILMICITTIVAVGQHGLQQWQTNGFSFWDIFRYPVPILLAGLTAYMLWWGRVVFKEQILQHIPQVGTTAWAQLQHLSVSQVLNMVTLRTTSLISLTSSIFMRRIRQLGFEKVYSAQEFEGKRISNLVYNLSDGRSINRSFVQLPDSIQRPSAHLREVATIAAEMPTTLWFNSPTELPSLVASGQATICLNLIKFVVRHHGKDPSTYPEEIKPLWKQLTQDWEAFGEDAYHLVRQAIPEEEMPVLTLPN